MFFCCVSCCSALVNALRAVLSDSVTELSLFRASEMALSFRVCCPSRRACCASRTTAAWRLQIENRPGSSCCCRTPRRICML
ncbi:hypothetical protein EST46_19290 [Escherichia coli]|nr:hypothetical protein [Salmonella enterica subsp. enterica serovar Javiana]MBW5356926.1 hypothetical protein [Escherichia coli]QED72881.1 hypothetical protein FTV92_29080 [Escherichia coli]